MALKEEPYPSNTTDHEWQLIEALLPERTKLGRPPRYERRLVVDAIFYVVRSGCTWRMLPKEFPHWRLVYYYFSRWQEMGIWQQANDRLREKVRLGSSKKKPPRRRSSTAKVLKCLASPESVDLMRAKRSEDVSGIFWWIRLD